MILEHWIYSTAIAIIMGMIYYKYTGRDHLWIIIGSSYAPDMDVIADSVFKKMGITVLIYGNHIKHGDFHNIAKDYKTGLMERVFSPLSGRLL